MPLGMYVGDQKDKLVDGSGLLLSLVLPLLRPLGRNSRESVNGVLQRLVFVHYDWFPGSVNGQNYGRLVSVFCC